MTMADEIAVMNEGHVEQRGSASELYERPATEFVANFLGVSNLIDGSMRDRSGRLADFETHDGVHLRVPTEAAEGQPNGALKVGVRPEKITLSGAGNGSVPADANVLRGRVSVASYLGVAIQYVIETPGGEELTVIAQNQGAAGPESIGPGRDVVLSWDPRHTFIVAKEESNV